MGIDELIQSYQIEFNKLNLIPHSRLFLKIHHTIESESEKRKIQFKFVDICSSNDIVAAVDEIENLFIFDLKDKCFWQLTEVSIANISSIKFVPPHFNRSRKQNPQDEALSGHGRSSNLLIGNKSGFIYEIEITTARVLRSIRGFSSEINQLLCSSSSESRSKTFLASTTNQIKIYEHDKFTRKSEFSFRNELRIKFVKWMPHDEKILAILTNDTICIFGDGSLLKPIRHYEPLKAREKFLRKSNHRIELLKYICDEIVNDDQDMRDIEMSERYLASSKLEPCTADESIKNERIIKSVTRDYQNGVITDISFHTNGSNGASAVVALMDNTIIQISTTMWDVRRVIAYPDFYIKQCQFIAHLEEFKVLLTRTSNDELMLTCMNGHDLNSRMLIDMNNLNSFVLSANGRLLVNMQQSGEMLVYNLENHLNDLMIIKEKGVDGKRRNNGMTMANGAVGVDDERVHQKMNKEMLSEIQMKMTNAMPRARLLPILREFAEYPDKYRVMMWKTLLKLPENCDSFAALLKQDLISGVSNYDKRFPLVDHKALNNLKQIMSCIVHWTPIFEHVRYLPKFIFPFVKMSKGDLLFAFELIVTLLLNHCQLWFEFLPLVDVPYNYLNIVENILMEVDKKLYEFYKSKGITTQQYALPLMESAFSEVLDQSLWLQLWDHLVTFETYYLVFIIVAFNSILRSTIMRCEDVESIENIFHEQSFVNIKNLMKKAQSYMKKCPPGIHPKHYMTTFMPLASNVYRKFENYQKNLINSKNVSELDALKSEQKILDQKLVELESYERSMEAKLESCLVDEEYSKRLKEVEAKFEQAVEEEEQRIIYQRKLLLLNMKKVREKEIETIIRMKNASLRNSVERSERDLDVMLRAIEKQRQREEIEIQMADENLKLKEVLLEMKAFGGADISNTSGSHHVLLAKKYESMLIDLGTQHKKFMNELGQTESTLPRILKESLEAESSSITASSTSSTTATSLKTFPSQQSQEVLSIEAMEKAFHSLRNEYDACVGKPDYKEHMKKLEREMRKLESEIKSILSDIKI